jgi:hypothetical protein
MRQLQLAATQTPQERLAQAASRMTAQSNVVVDVNEKTVQDAPGAIFSSGVATWLSPFFEHACSQRNLRTASGANISDSGRV